MSKSTYDEIFMDFFHKCKTQFNYIPSEIKLPKPMLDDLHSVLRRDDSNRGISQIIFRTAHGDVKITQAPESSELKFHPLYDGGREL